MVSTLDLFPTLLAAAGAPADEGLRLDGVDLAPYLAGEKTGAPHSTLYWRSGPNGAARSGHWKLLVAGDLVRLYDLASDPRETRDLATEKTDVTARLRRAWSEWNATLSAPRQSARTVVTDHGGDSIRWHI
jgi:arylsulfatase A-like enzyme